MMLIIDCFNRVLPGVDRPDGSGVLQDHVDLAFLPDCPFRRGLRLSGQLGHGPDRVSLFFPRVRRVDGLTWTGHDAVSTLVL